VLAVLLVNPTDIFMPEPIVMMLILALFAFFGLLALFVFKERARDEREEALRMKAGRAAFIVGGSILVIGIGVQGFQHNVDPWLVLSLAGMVFAKSVIHLTR